MTTDEIRMVLDALRQLSGDASNAALWWLVAHYGAEVAGSLIVAGTLIGLGAVLLRVVRAVIGMNEWAEFGRETARALGGRGTEYSYREDKQKITAAILAAARETKK